jgi:hypothetical protein
MLTERFQPEALPVHDILLFLTRIHCYDQQQIAKYLMAFRDFVYFWLQIDHLEKNKFTIPK